ncbi:hypothetical protein O6H91_04G101400 [Diphasiastrum complanatum]|uniref:Uncharacterized protein n=1 Tax=Diphasiastrum complanatum TaxID=34168 RepID=A0ACC2E009_DIPCM|nr:hypothetical protein O6H91_Y177400 [Diphasiastrum complanatum]KAJ7559789.1 hypothetical protein O6H91_04G101400 [Diphasiastrum complanatum]
MMAITKKQGPEWLLPFLAGKYFSHCKHHIAGKNEKNHFCIDCIQGPLCSSGLDKHASHNTLQVRRASHMDAVRFNDIQKYLDVSNIQSYTINGAKIIFLLSRPPSRVAKAGFRSCEICERSIADPVRFCSIACKLACAKQNLDDTSLSLSLGLSYFQAQTLNATERNSLYKGEPNSPPMLCDYEDEAHGLGPSTPKSMKRRMIEQWQLQHLELHWKKAKLKNLTGNSKRKLHRSSPSFNKDISASALDTVSNGKFKPLATPGSMLQTSAFAPSTPESGEFLSFRARPRKGTPHRAPLS